MALVLVHGVPDTRRVWDALLAELGRPEAVALELPGFGCEVPDGFAATKEAYAEWLRRRLEELGGPHDLVAHDWGAMLLLRAISLEPELARSWAVGGGTLDEEYRWHEVARAWQTPGAGEALLESMTPESLREALAAQGVPEAAARETAEHVDDRMKRCILQLYRSAADVGREWAGDIGRIRSPGLVLWGERDPYVAPAFGERLARRTAARCVVFEGCGHWWQLERPREAARLLAELWARV